ncbi:MULTISPECIES: hypothetical protein [Streptomyces]|uniref:hypothetical protein n=1 Tax=Streptomyces TaxID=1883 RepID=UPI003329AC4A
MIPEAQAEGRDDCPHEEAYGLAALDDQRDENDPDTWNFPWKPVDPDRAGDFQGLRGTVVLGTCAECGALVACVDLYDHDRWDPTAERKQKWSTKWTRLR